MRASSLRRSTSLTFSAIRAALGRGSRSNSVNSARTCGTVTGGFFFPQPPPLQLQEPPRQQRQRHVVLPAHPRPHLVVVQPHLLVPFTEQLLRPRPLPVRPHPRRQRH